MAALVEMSVQGVSTRKVKAIREDLCGHECGASTIGELTTKLDAELERFARQALEGEYPHQIRGLASEPHEEWLDGPVYLDLQPLREALKPSLQLAA